ASSAESGFVAGASASASFSLSVAGSGVCEPADCGSGMTFDAALGRATVAGGSAADGCADGAGSTLNSGSLASGGTIESEGRLAGWVLRGAGVEPDAGRIPRRWAAAALLAATLASDAVMSDGVARSEEHTSELQSHLNLVC